VVALPHTGEKGGRSFGGRLRSDDWMKGVNKGKWIEGVAQVAS